jgi:hypothetical protein
MDPSTMRSSAARPECRTRSRRCRRWSLRLSWRQALQAGEHLRGGSQACGFCQRDAFLRRRARALVRLVAHPLDALADHCVGQSDACDCCRLKRRRRGIHGRDEDLGSGEQGPCRVDRRACAVRAVVTDQQPCHGDSGGARCMAIRPSSVNRGARTTHSCAPISSRPVTTMAAPRGVRQHVVPAGAHVVGTTSARCVRGWSPDEQRSLSLPCAR